MSPTFDEIVEHVRNITRLNTQALMAEQAHSDAVAQLYATHTADQWSAAIDRLDDHQRRRLEAVVAQAPKGYEYKAMELTIKAMSYPELGAEDRHFLAEARSALLDAHFAATDGDFETAATQCERSYNRLHFMLYGRKRGDSRAYRHPPNHIMEALAEMLVVIGSLIQMLNRARRSTLVSA